MPTISTISVDFATDETFSPLVLNKVINPYMMAKYCLGDDYTFNPTFSGGFLKRSGDTATGPLYVPLTAPVTNTQVANKKYVDDTALTVDNRVTTVDNRITSLSATASLVCPIGAIIMWAGSSASVPSNWRICDGTGGTPDLRDRFIVGSGRTYTTGNVGGLSAVTLEIDEMPKHRHTVTTSIDDTPSGSGSVTADNSSGNYTTTVNTSYVGGLNGNGVTQAHENRPPYYALAYIMRIS